MKTRSDEPSDPSRRELAKLGAASLLALGAASRVEARSPEAQATRREGDVRPPRPPIIIKGGSFALEHPQKLTRTDNTKLSVAGPMGVVSVIAFTIIPPQLSAQIVPDVDRVEITISVAGCSTTPTFSVENDGASTVVTTDKAMGEIETNHPVFPWHYVHPGYDVDCPPVPPTKAFTITRVTLWKAGAAVYTSETANAEYRIVV